MQKYCQAELVSVSINNYFRFRNKFGMTKFGLFKTPIFRKKHATEWFQYEPFYLFLIFVRYNLRKHLKIA